MAKSMTLKGEDFVVIERIATRATRLGCTHGRSKLDVMLDLTACHVNGCPLDLPALEHAEDVHLIHDVMGIAVHLDHNTGGLLHHFTPRYARSYTSQKGSQP